jgi:hypothetical protein
MPSVDVQIRVAAFLEQCAQQRVSAVLPVYEHDGARLLRMLQAEAAGRELVTALVRPNPYPDQSQGAIIRRLLGYIQTVLVASTPDEEIAPLLTVRAHHIALDPEGASLLRDAAILLVLAASDDGARNIDVRLESTDCGAHLTIESDRPGVTVEQPSMHGLRSRIAAHGGSWDVTRPVHGSSWLVHVGVPALQVRETSDQEAAHAP